MSNNQSHSLIKILAHLGYSDADVVKVFRMDEKRIVAECSINKKRFILKGISAIRYGTPLNESIVLGNVSAHKFLGNMNSIAPCIFPIDEATKCLYMKMDGYWFYLIELIDGRKMQSTANDEYLLGRLAKKLHSLCGYEVPSALNEDKSRFYGWFHDKPFKTEFDSLLNKLPDFSKYDRCFIHTDLGPHNAMVKTNGEALLIDLDDSGIGSRYLDLGWAFIMQFVEHTENMRLSYRFDLAKAFLSGYYGSLSIPKEEYDLIWQGAIYMHISYMQMYGPYAVDSLWAILQFGLGCKDKLWNIINNS